MRTIIAGSREISEYAEVEKAMKECGWIPNIVLSGAARGVDLLGEKWAETNGIPVVRFPADWNRYRKAAGPIRNKQMADTADALVAIWDGASPGTLNMIEQARRKGLKVHVHWVRKG